MTDRRLDLVVIGECNVDLLVFGVPPLRFSQVEQLVDSTTLTMGSSGAITACVGARLGLSVAFVSVAGDDLFGRFMVDGLRRHGVEPVVQLRPDLTTGSTVVLERQGQRSLLTHKGSIGALTPSDVPGDLLRRARHVHISSWFLQDGLRADGDELLRLAQGGGATTSLDPNWDPDERWELGAVADYVDLFLPNEHELLGVTGSADVNEAIAHWSSSKGSVAAKLGERGACGHLNGQDVFVSAPQVDVVDTTGAGDNFDAGVIAGLLRGLEPVEALRTGVAVGALSAGAAGGTGRLPTWEQARHLARSL